MSSAEEMLLQLTVVKRDGKKVAFNGDKIALAIKKGFDSVTTVDENDERKPKYNEKDIQKVYQAVIHYIEKEYKDKEKIKIEEIQDIIELELKNKKYEDVYQSFSEYRERRAQSRNMFMDDKRSHKFLKTIEGLGLKSAVKMILREKMQMLMVIQQWVQCFSLEVL